MSEIAEPTATHVDAVKSEVNTEHLKMDEADKASKLSAVFGEVDGAATDNGTTEHPANGTSENGHKTECPQEPNGVAKLELTNASHAGDAVSEPAGDVKPEELPSEKTAGDDAQPDVRDGATDSSAVTDESPKNGDQLPKKELDSKQEAESTSDAAQGDAALSEAKEAIESSNDSNSDDAKTADGSTEQNKKAESTASVGTDESAAGKGSPSKELNSDDADAKVSPAKVSPSKAAPSKVSPGGKKSCSPF